LKLKVNISILDDMKLVANIQLKPTTEQFDLLRLTLERCNAACTWLSQKGFEAGIVRQYDLQKLVYRDIRERFDLTAQAAIRCIAKVADAYTTQTANGREGVCAFRKHAAQPYDDRIFRFLSDDMVSIWTIAGRQKISFVCGERQRKLLAYRKGEVDLCFIKGKWYLACVCDIPDPDEIDVEGILGVDFGIVNLAFDSEGRAYTGDAVEAFRRKMAKRKAGLQKRGTKAAKRRLKKLARKEARFRAHVNHCISKEIVANAERSRLAIAIEDLTHICKRVKAPRADRNRRHSWSFAQLRQFLTYKARMSGVPLIAINPAYTSQACPCCGVIDRANRPTQASFSCVSCGHTEAADFVAAKNISSFARAAVTRPQVLGSH